MITTEEELSDGRILRARSLRKKRKQELLLAARRVFAEKGYHAGSISDIIEAAGVARGTFYLYFEGKRLIFEEIVDSLLEQLRECISPVDLSSPKTPSAQLQDNVDRVLELFAANQDLLRILLLQAVGLDREFDQRLADFYGDILQMIRNSLEIGMAMGIVRPVNATLTSHFILGSLKETLSAAFLSTSAEFPDLNSIATDLLRYNTDGLFVHSFQG